MHYILFYDVADDYVARREPHRAAHLALASAAFDRGELVLGGALTDPTDTAILVFRTHEAAEAFVLADPYVLNGMVKHWRVREWMTVIGEGSTPVGMP
ncbi:MAG: YciI-like protein [Acidobacteriota bacterium]|nr:YciI-like protein [Acidobacteriota bacterium]